MVLRLRPFVGIISFGLVGLALLAFFYKKTTVPEIDRDIQHKFDLGFVPPGHVFNKTLSVTNKSTETWKLKEIRQSCSCTQAEVTKHVLKPGDSTDITVQFTSPEQESDQQHSVDLIFKADCQPIVSISVTSKTRKPLSVDRKHLELTTTNVKPVTFFELFVSNFSGKPWTTISGEELPSYFKIQSIEKQPPVPWGELWKMVLANDGSQLKSGVDSGMLTIRPNDLTERIPFHASHDEGIRYSPTKFDVGQVQVDKFNLRTTVQVDSVTSNLTKDDFALVVHDPQVRAELEQLTLQRPGRAILSIGLSRLKRQPGRQQLTFDIVYGGPKGVKQSFSVTYQFD